MIELSPKQKIYLKDAGARWNFKCGAVRSGKSFVDTAAVIPQRIIDREGAPGLNVIIGVSNTTIERNVLQPMREIYGHRIGQINNKNIATLFGQEVYCLGAEKVSQVAKIQGASFKYCYGDEVAKWNQDVFEMLKSRLDKPYSMFDGACNPEYPNHYIKKFLDSDADIFLQEYTIFDNPFLDKKFVDDLCKEYEGTVYFDRLILGKWTRAEGLIYPMLTDANLYDDETRPKGLEYTAYRIISCDYGTTNPCVFLDTYDDGETLYIDNEWRWDSKSKEAIRTGQPQKTDEQYCIAMCEFMGADPQFKCGIIVDPSAASFIQALKRRGFIVTAGDNTVLDGIRNVASMLATRKIKIHVRCKGLLDEMHSYSWDSKSGLIGDEKPVKTDDHAPDALRYRVNALPSWRKTK